MSARAEPMPPTEDRIVKEIERRHITGRGRTAWFHDEKAGRVPQRVKLGPKSIGWRMSELQAWVRGEWNDRAEGAA